MRNRFFLVLCALVIQIIGTTNIFAAGEKLRIGLKEKEDATYAVLKTLQKAKTNGASSISFEKGTYHFYPEKAYEEFCFISNHNDALTNIAFFMEEMSNFTIDGNGSTFIFHGRMIPFLIKNSENINVKNVSIDFAEPFHSEGKVIARDEKNMTFDMEMTSEFPYEIRDGKLFYMRSYYTHDLGQSIVFNPETMSVSFDTERYQVPMLGGTKDKFGDVNMYKYKQDMKDIYLRENGRQNTNKVMQVSPGVVRVLNCKKELPPMGHIFVSKGEQGTNRFAPAFKMNNVTNFYAENVIIYHAGGMGFLAENCNTVDIYKCKIIPTETRIISATADATHFVGCRGKVSLRDCVFHNQLDDAMNVHGAYQEVMDVIDNRTIGVRVGHFQQLGFQLAFAGDKVGFIRLKDSFHSYYTCTVKSTEVVNGRYQVITFNEDIPSKVAAGDMLENLTAYPEVLVENCDISRNRARGLLISTPIKTTVRNNYFATQMEAILIPVESGSWYESGNGANITIEGNTFENCLTSHSGKRGVIRFHTDDKTSNPAFSNILIKDNKFNQSDNWILEISNVDGIEFSGNTITNPGTYPMYGENDPVVTINHSTDVVFKKNTYKAKAKEMVKMLDGSKVIKFK